MKDTKRLVIWSVFAVFAVAFCVVFSLDKNEITVRNTVDSIMLDIETKYTIGDCVDKFRDIKGDNNVYWTKLDSSEPNKVVYLLNLSTETTKARAVMGFRIDGQQYVSLDVFQLYDDYGTKTVEEFGPFAGGAVIEFCNILKNRN